MPTNNAPVVQFYTEEGRLCFQTAGNEINAESESILDHFLNGGYASVIGLTITCATTLSALIN